MSVRIVTDSTCDLPAEVIAEHNIAVVPLYINFGAQSYLDGVDLSRSQFYARLPGVPIRMVGEVAPVIGAHVGPGAVGIVCTRSPEPRPQRS